MFADGILDCGLFAEFLRKFCRMFADGILDCRLFAEFLQKFCRFFADFSTKKYVLSQEQIVILLKLFFKTLYH